MKKFASKTRGLVKGAPTGVLISIAIHVGLIFGLGAMVVFKYIVREEQEFELPEPVEQKKMELKKPQVKMKKKARPRPANRIVSKAVAVMPEVALPNVSGTGTDMGGFDGGFDLLPDISEMSAFGSTKSISVGNDFEGTFYSIAYDRSGEEQDCDDPKWLGVVHDFLESGWNPYVLAPYYRAPQRLYTSQIFIPIVYSEYGPSNFGIPISPDFMASYWIVHYKGNIMSPYDKPKRFRFWGMGDDFLPITLTGGKEIVYDNEMVADFSWVDWDGFVTDWKNENSGCREQIKIGHHSYVYKGNWFTLEPGEIYEMNLLLGESWGGHFCAYLMVEEEGKSYEKNEDGLMYLPIFKVAELPGIVKDKIKYTLIKGEADLDSDLMFNVY